MKWGDEMFRKGDCRVRRTGSVVVLEEFEPEAEGWYTLATLHEPQEFVTGQRLLDALADYADLRAKFQQAQANLRWAREQAERDSRKVKQAQEERDRAREAMSSYRTLMATRRAERDAAIERGRRLRQDLALAMAGHKAEVLADYEARAEAAEQDAAEQRALAEKCRRAVWWAIWAVEQGTFLRTADWWDYFYAAGALATPAEVHPQQEEGDSG